MKKMTTKAKAFNTTKANAGHDKKKARKARRTALRLKAEHITALIKSGRYRQMPLPTDISKLKDIAVEPADTDTIKL
jgi:hypothetical protein